MTLQAVSTAVNGVSQLTYELLHKNQRQLIDDAYESARVDVQTFTKVLLDAANGLPNSGDRIQLMLDGLLRLIPADLSPTDLERLRAVFVSEKLTLYDLLGLYAIGRGAQYEYRVVQIIQTQPKES